jgi:plastocyanin
MDGFVVRAGLQARALSSNRDRTPMTARCRLSSLALLVAIAGCGAAPPPPAQTGGGKPVDAATAGSIAGRVVFEGTPPAPEPLRMTSDASCTSGAGPNPMSDAVLVAGDGGVKNAFVYLKSGLDAAYSFDVPAQPAVLDQRGCIYTPRVLGVRVGQRLDVLNSDTTMHNVHALPMANQEFNKSTPIRGSSIPVTFTVPEVPPMRFMCNVHSWMSAYVGVVAHPFFAVTGADGQFALSGVPPGTYTVEAWHEKFGTRTATITIGEKQAGSLTFSFSQTQSQ